MTATLLDELESVVVRATGSQRCASASARRRRDRRVGRDRYGVTDPKQVVRSGYDEIADRYDKWASSFESPELAWVSELLSRLDRDAHVLDLGCGGGRRPAQIVAAAHRYTGVDLSTVQIERARRRIPSGRFIVADATQLELAPESFDAVMSHFVLGHIPRSEQGPLLEHMHSWLRPGGWDCCAHDGRPGGW